MTGLEKLCSLVMNGSGKRRKRKQNNQFIVYYRVSTRQQGESGLGLDAQKAAAEAYVAQHNGTIVGTYVEVRSGKDSTRPEIIKRFCTRTRLVGYASHRQDGPTFSQRILHKSADGEPGQFYRV